MQTQIQTQAGANRSIQAFRANQPVSREAATESLEDLFRLDDFEHVNGDFTDAFADFE